MQNRMQESLLTFYTSGKPLKISNASQSGVGTVIMEKYNAISGLPIWRHNWCKNQIYADWRVIGNIHCLWEIALMYLWPDSVHGNRCRSKCLYFEDSKNDAQTSKKNDLVVTHTTGKCIVTKDALSRAIHLAIKPERSWHRSPSLCRLKSLSIADRKQQQIKTRERQFVVTKVTVT